MLYLIDNYDSFTYNVVTYLGQLGAITRIIRNDEITPDELSLEPVSGIVISPGPGTPNQSGISLEIIRRYCGHTPILGICLGHEVIGQVFGAKIVHANHVMHGKTSLVHHDGRGVFEGVPNPVRVARYHSLVISPQSLPEELEISAWTLDDQGHFAEIMGIRHKSLMTEGIQFHPEAILTEYGHLMLANFIRPLTKDKLAS